MLPTKTRTITHMQEFIIFGRIRLIATHGIKTRVKFYSERYVSKLIIISENLNTNIVLGKLFDKLRIYYLLKSIFEFY